MVQTYQGYFLDDGRFVPDDLFIKPPAMRRVIVNVLDEEVEDNTDVSHSNLKARDMVERIEMILAAALDAKDDMTDEEWDEMLRLRSITNVGLSRAVEI